VTHKTLEEYCGLIDQKLYLVKLLLLYPFALSPPFWNGRNSAAVIKFPHWSLPEDCRPGMVDRATHADIINGFKTGSAAYCTLPRDTLR
jgi:hypothetical protein